MQLRSERVRSILGNCGRLLLMLFFVLFIQVSLQAQVKQYKLYSKTDRADFNYSALRRIDKTGPKHVRSAFDPVRGKRTVYIFIATFRGQSYRGGEEEFNDILIIKTNKEAVILDGYQYTLEWAEMPLTSDLNRLTRKDLKLSGGLHLSQLKLQNVFDKTIDRIEREEGMIEL